MDGMLATWTDHSVAGDNMHGGSCLLHGWPLLRLLFSSETIENRLIYFWGFFFSVLFSEIYS
jgi:hypothetical protein